MKRRMFMANTALAVAGTAVFGCGKSNVDTTTTGTGAKTTASGMPIGIQLYTLRDILKDNTKVKDTIKQIADWGYTELETFGYSNGTLFGMPSKEFNDYVKSVGARVTSGHYGIDVIRGDWAKAVADAKDAGQEFMVLPWLAEADRTADGYKKIIEDVNKAAEVTKAAGIQMQYHNHAFEFDKIAGTGSELQKEGGETTGFDILMGGLDPNLVSIELDLYWAVRAGADPEQLISKYPGRFQQWHVKDMDKTDKAKNANIGSGSIDFPKLFTLASQSGMKHWYVEYDTFPDEPLTGAQKSIEYLKTI